MEKQEMAQMMKAMTAKMAANTKTMLAEMKEEMKANQAKADGDRTDQEPPTLFIFLVFLS
jgi:hypothetical protein